MYMTSNLSWLWLQGYQLNVKFAACFLSYVKNCLDFNCSIFGAKIFYSKHLFDFVINLTVFSRSCQILDKNVFQFEKMKLTLASSKAWSKSNPRSFLNRHEKSWNCRYPLNAFLTSSSGVSSIFLSIDFFYYYLT